MDANKARLAIRIGQGIDIHPFEKGRDLILGGVHLQHEFGLAGHSDADALTHAICDALLGALSLGDIGQHFSDQDQKHKNRNSQDFLSQVHTKIQDCGYVIGNIDSTILTEQPKIAPYIEDMKTALATTLSIDTQQISIKATRAEKLGFVGKQEGLVAMANVLLFSR